jgi:hypothetical protein
MCESCHHPCHRQLYIWKHVDVHNSPVWQCGSNVDEELVAPVYGRYLLQDQTHGLVSWWNDNGDLEPPSLQTETETS